MNERLTVGEDEAGVRIDVYLAARLGITRSRVKRTLIDGGVTDAVGSVLKPSYVIEAGDVICFTASEPQTPQFKPENTPLDIVYRDESIIVVNKPPGQVVHPGRGVSEGTIASALLYHIGTLSDVGGATRPGIVHRLDKDTSGLMVVALNDAVHHRLSSMIQARDVERTYTAFVWGTPDPEAGSIDAPIGRNPSRPTLKAVVHGGRHALTHYETVTPYGFITELSVHLETGRTHQIRVHFASRGHHVFGDPHYGGRDERLKGFDPTVRVRARRLLALIPRQALHAGKLAFDHPLTGVPQVFTAPEPADMAALRAALDA